MIDWVGRMRRVMSDNTRRYEACHDVRRYVYNDLRSQSLFTAVSSMAGEAEFLKSQLATRLTMCK